MSWIAQVFHIGKKKVNVVYGPEDEEGDNIPRHLEPFREMTLRSTGKTVYQPASGKKLKILTTNGTQPAKPGENKPKEKKR